MKKFFSKKVVIIIIVTLFIVLSAAITVTVSDAASGRIANIVNTITAPVKKVMASVVDSFEQLYDYLYKYDILESENEELKARIAELEQQEREFDEISQENEDLRALLEFSKRNEEYEFEAVSVISWGASNYASSFTISKGENSGLALNDCVITGSGQLIGRITQVSPTTATVTTIIDSSTSLSAVIYEVDELAIVEGNFNLMQEGKLMLTYLDESSKIVEGNTIITSGRTGTYPKGLVVGTVETISIDISGLNDHAVIVPAADLEQLAMVYVVTDFGLDE